MLASHFIASAIYLIISCDAWVLHYELLWPSGCSSNMKSSLMGNSYINILALL